MNLLAGRPQQLVYNRPEGFQGEKINALGSHSDNLLRCGVIQKKKKLKKTYILTVLKQLFWEVCKNAHTCELFMQIFFKSGPILFYGNRALFLLYYGQTVLIHTIICKYAECFLDNNYA